MTHYPIFVIGAGAASLVVAIGAAKAGKKVLLMEKGHWGGDYTNFGCIPSKSLIASANAAHHFKNIESLGIRNKDSSFAATNALKRVPNMIEEIRPYEDSNLWLPQTIVPLIKGKKS